MPLLKLTTNAPASPTHEKLLAGLSSFVAAHLDKPESLVMTLLERPLAMSFAGTSEPACFVELKSVGRFRPESTLKLSAELCERLSVGLGVAKSRVFIEFTGTDGYLWGHNGTTFG